MANHMRAELVVDALQMALARRRPRPGLIHHSDTNGPRMGHGDDSERQRASEDGGAEAEDSGPFQGTSEMARPGLEPGTPRFSGAARKPSNRDEVPA
jgi:hypothetical protein